MYETLQQTKISTPLFPRWPYLLELNLSYSHHKFCEETKSKEDMAMSLLICNDYHLPQPLNTIEANILKRIKFSVCLAKPPRIIWLCLHLIHTYAPCKACLIGNSSSQNHTTQHVNFPPQEIGSHPSNIIWNLSPHTLLVSPYARILVTMVNFMNTTLDIMTEHILDLDHDQ